jgi:hypothetical protein
MIGSRARATLAAARAMLGRRRAWDRDVPYPLQDRVCRIVAEAAE